MTELDTIRAQHLIHAHAMSARLSSGHGLADTLARIREVTRAPVAA